MSEYIGKAAESKIMGFVDYDGKTYSARLSEKGIPCASCCFYNKSGGGRACFKPECLGSCLAYKNNKWNANIFWYKENESNRQRLREKYQDAIQEPQRKK